VRKAKRPIGWLLLISAFVVLIVLLMQPLEVYHFRDYVSVLFPKGSVAVEQRNLLLFIQAIMLLVIVPVYIFIFIFSWKYRAHNEKSVYDPHLIDSALAEYVWWGIPLVLTLVIAVVTWIKTYELDPYKPLDSAKKEMTIQVVALQWKWLFIYPEEKIAAVNFVHIPKDVPIHFEITADAPMNSFWIPDLGGQIYAMPNMKTELYLIANESGDFRGSSANLSGEGFAGMNFIARASSEDEYRKWIEAAKQSPQMLNLEEYDRLAVPSKNNQAQVYRLQDEHLFHEIMMKYMHPKKIVTQNE